MRWQPAASIQGSVLRWPPKELVPILGGSSTWRETPPAQLPNGGGDEGGGDAWGGSGDSTPICEAQSLCPGEGRPWLSVLLEASRMTQP